MKDFNMEIKEIRQRAIRFMNEGAVTRANKTDTDKVVKVLNEALATELVCTLRYKQHYFAAKGIHSEAIAAEFKEHADQEFAHADKLARRIVQLGGKPNFNPQEIWQTAHAEYSESESLAEMIRANLVAERIAIEVYSQVIRWIGDSDPTTRRLLEDILEQEEEHADELSDLLTDEMHVDKLSDDEDEMSVTHASSTMNH